MFVVDVAIRQGLVAELSGLTVKHEHHQPVEQTRLSLRSGALALPPTH